MELEARVKIEIRIGNTQGLSGVKCNDNIGVCFLCIKTFSQDTRPVHLRDNF